MNGTSTSQWTTTLSWPGARLLTVPEERASTSPITIALLSGFAFPVPTSPWMGWEKRGSAEGKDCGYWEGSLPREDGARHHPAQGSCGSSWGRWVHPSAHCEGGEAEGPEAIQ